MKNLRLLLIDNLDMPLKSAYRFPQAGVPLGILTLSAYIKQSFPDKVEYIDNISLPLLLHEGKNPIKEVIKMIESKGYDLIGIRSLSAGKDYLEELTSTIKKCKDAPPIIVGGPYASDSASLVLDNHKSVDFSCTSEGEEVFRQFLELWFYKKDKAYLKVGGLGYRLNGMSFINPQMPFIEDLDSLPIPDYDSVSLKKYTAVENPMRIPNGVLWAPIMTQRGCPFKCTYCHEGFGKRSRERSPDKVVEDILYLYQKKGVRHLTILDDIFNVRRKRAKEIMRGIIKSGIKDLQISFPNGLRGDIIDFELIDLMIEAGTICIHYAVESASPRIQKWMKKHLNMDKITKTIEYTSQFDIIFRGFYMVGFPGETEEELRSTIDHAINSGFTETYFSILCMWPGTKIYDAAVQSGFVEEGNFTHLTQFDVKNNGFLYTEDFMMNERTRGYGYTHFDAERVRKNFRVYPSLGISKERIVQKEAEYAKMITEDYRGTGPNPYIPDQLIFQEFLKAGKNEQSEDVTFDRINHYLNANV